MTIVLGALTLWVASELDRMDARRREAERALRAAYAELDRRVIERTAALERATALVHERTRLLGTITASTPDLIVAQDLDGRVLLANPAWLEAMGRTEADALGRRAIDLTRDPEEARRSAEHQRAIVESGHSSVVEEVFTGSGGPRTYLTTKSPLRDEQGRIVGLVGVATDITDRKRAERELESLVATEQRLREEAERANRAKDEFLAIVSHELRSPLNALRGWGHLLASTRPLDPALVERATAAIKRSVEHQARLIDDLLDTARIMSGKLTLEPRPLNLVEVVHAALDTARPAAAAKHVELRAAFDHPVVTVEGDGGRLQQVVTNLLSNAIKFTPENGRVEVGVLLAGDRIRLSVHDDGIGIAPEFLPHVFDRFTQADTSTTRRAGGWESGSRSCAISSSCTAVACAPRAAAPARARPSPSSCPRRASPPGARVPPRPRASCGRGTRRRSPAARSSSSTTTPTRARRSAWCCARRARRSRRSRADRNSRCGWARRS
jgi:PAS domain S-box-containing protein